jgi:hypothetical protein
VIQFFALKSDHSPTSLLPIGRPYRVNVMKDRIAAFTAFINVLRWVRSVAASSMCCVFSQSHLLAGELSPTIPMHKSVRHQSPYYSDKKVIITAHHHFVEKKFKLPGENVPDFNSVYQAIRHCNHCVQVTIIVDGKEVAKLKKNKDYEIVLQLRPVAAMRKVPLFGYAISYFFLTSNIFPFSAFHTGGITRSSDLHITIFGGFS